MRKRSQQYHDTVFGTSRGMGGFLHYGKNQLSNNIITFPAPSEGWVGSYMNKVILVGRTVFPAPLKVWVGSYRVYVTEVVADKLFPTPSEVWVGSYESL